MRELDQERVHNCVSRETYERLAIIVAQLHKWQPRINLVSPSTVATVWRRHILDSLQLFMLYPDALRWLDIGSGGGFPGLVLGALLAEKQSGQITLVESNAKKCAFLRETARLAKLPAVVVNKRIEEVLPELNYPYQILTARALAPLDRLLGYAQPFLDKGTVCLFPKGQDVDEEIENASRCWNFTYDLVDSETDVAAKIMIVKSASRRG